MESLFNSVDEYIKAVKQKAADVAAKASQFLRDAADWIDAQAKGIRFTDPDATRKLSLRQAECLKLAAEDKNADLVASVLGALQRS